MEEGAEVTVFRAEFQTHLASLWLSLYRDRSQAGASLLCREGRQVRAHPVFLCQSPLLSSLLLDSTEAEPVIQLAGAGEEELHLLLEFLYLGQVNISHDQVEPLLGLARELGVSQLENILMPYKSGDRPILKIKEKDTVNHRGEPCEEFQIIEINPKLQSLVLIDKDELYEEFFPKHHSAETKIIEEEDKVEEIKEKVSKEEVRKEEVIKDVTKNHKLKEEITNEEEVLEEEIMVTQVETILKEEISPSVSLNAPYMQEENTVETAFILTSEQVEYEESNNDGKDVSSHNEELENFDEYDENDYQDYEEEEIFDISNETKTSEDLPTENENTAELNVRKKKTRGEVILPNLTSNKCPECEETFGNRKLVRRHYVRKHIGKRYQCQECNKKYFEAVHLRRHIRVEHQKVRLACDSCESEFTEKKSLRKHIEAIHENITVSCDLCEFVTSSKGNLKRHHESVHDGIKYSCDKCDKQFSDKGYLHKHNRATHENIRYACRQCENTYTHKNSLALHVQAHHDQVKYVCDICGVEYNMRRNLMLHYRRKHSSDGNVWNLKNYKKQ